MPETNPPDPIRKPVLLARYLPAVITVLSIAVILIVAVSVTPHGVLNIVVRGAADDTSALRARAAEFGEELTAGRIDLVYRLFNPGFRAENSVTSIDSSIRLWLDGRIVRAVRTGFVRVNGPSGMVSSYVYFVPSARDTSGSSRFRERDRLQEYVFQYWLRTPDGWQLMWLNKLLDPVSMDYGHTDSAAMDQVRQLALQQAVTKQGIQEQIGLACSSDRLVMLSHGPDHPRLELPGIEILWVSMDSIRRLGSQLGVDYVVDIQPIRVLSSTALVSLDVLPVPGGSAGGRRRSIKLFFVREKGQWKFVDFGANW